MQEVETETKSKQTKKRKFAMPYAVDEKVFYTNEYTYAQAISLKSYLLGDAFVSPTESENFRFDTTPRVGWVPSPPEIVDGHPIHYCSSNSESKVREIVKAADLIRYGVDKNMTTKLLEQMKPFVTPYDFVVDLYRHKQKAYLVTIDLILYKKSDFRGTLGLEGRGMIVKYAGFYLMWRRILQILAFKKVCLKLGLGKDICGLVGSILIEIGIKG